MVEVGNVYLSKEDGLTLVVTFKKYGKCWGLWSSGQTFSFIEEEWFNHLLFLGKSKNNVNALLEIEE